MSLITRCPACGTMFKVVPDQLRISEGWVRCGHCADVFDARAHLQAEGATDPIQEVGAATAQSEPASESRRESESESEFDSRAFSSSLLTEIDDVTPSQGPDSAQLEAEEEALREHPLDRPFELRREDVSLPQENGEADEVGQIGGKAVQLERPRWPQPSQVQPGPDPNPSSVIRTDDDDPELHDISFVRDARRKAFRDQPMVRRMLMGVAAGLGFLLAAQIVVNDRDRIAVASPALRPFLEALCFPLDCLIRAPRQIESVTIDSSSFNKLRPDTYRLNLTLKNQSATEVAMPALELTLTDAQDQPVIRRVLLASELGTHRGVLSPTSDWSTSLALAVAPDGSAGRIAGYRLLAFYP